MTRKGLAAVQVHCFSITVVDMRKRQNQYTVQYVHEFTTIKKIKAQLSALLRCSVDDIILFHFNNPSKKNFALTDSTRLCDLKIDSSDGILEMATKASFNSVDSSIDVSRASEGSSGVYFIETHGGSNGKSSGSDCGDGNTLINVDASAAEEGWGKFVFKPFDEEPGMTNNPYDLDILRDNFKPGQGIIREYAAFLMDIDGFCRVPKTRLAYLEDQTFVYRDTAVVYPKYGALQEFVSNADSFENFGPNIFSDLEVQKIALFDIRTLNCDRNEQNILVVRPGHEGEISPQRDANGVDSSLILVPIDHGFCFPGQLKINNSDWTWLRGKQVHKPVLPEVKEYFKSLDIEKIVRILTEDVTLSKDSLFLVQVCHHLLRESFEMDLTFKEIAELITRDDPDEPSPLERLLATADQLAFETLDIRSGRFSSHGTLDNNSGKFHPSKNANDASSTDGKRARSKSFSYSSSRGREASALPNNFIKRTNSGELFDSEDGESMADSRLADSPKTSKAANLTENKMDNNRIPNVGASDIDPAFLLFLRNENNKPLCRLDTFHSVSSPSKSQPAQPFMVEGPRSPLSLKHPTDYSRSPKHSPSRLGNPLPPLPPPLSIDTNTGPRTERSFSDDHLLSPRSRVPSSGNGGGSVSRLFGKQDVVEMTDVSPLAPIPLVHTSSWDIKFKNENSESEVKKAYDERIMRKNSLEYDRDSHCSSTGISPISSFNNMNTSGDTFFIETPNSAKVTANEDPTFGNSDIFSGVDIQDIGGPDFNSTQPFPQPSKLPVSDELGSKLRRLVSFGGLNSAPMYDSNFGGMCDKSAAAVEQKPTPSVKISVNKTTRSEKNQLAYKASAEFLELRLEYSKMLVRAMVRSRSNSSIPVGRKVMWG